MISYLSGKLTEASSTKIVVEAGGVGYDVFIPLSTYDALPELNSEIKILTYQHIREDALDLYGFIASEERGLFKALLGITGIGPKVAMGILSGISIKEFYGAISNQDIKRLSSISGVGKKTAERLVLELKDKIGLISPGKIIAGNLKSKEGQVFDDVAGALVALGYKQYVAESAAQKVIDDNKDKKLPAEDLVRKALKYVS